MDFRTWIENEQAFDRVTNHTQTGKYFNDFFSKVSRGEFGKSSVGWVAGMEHHPEFHAELNRHTGNFDDHIAKSIPTFREIQSKKGAAIAATIKSGSLLDIGGSEGSFAKAVTAYSRGSIKSKVLDPNPDMAAFFNSKSVVGSSYDSRAFHRGWVNDDGSEVGAMNADNSTERFDVINETMTFQFINNQRSTHIREATRLLTPSGLLIVDEKVKNPAWDLNEAYKDTHHKNHYYSSSELAAKDKVVGFQKSNNVVGMVDNMVSGDELEKILLASFREVWQYWDAGNFRGYAASNDAAVVQSFVHNVGDVNNKFSRIRTPRKVVTTMTKNFGEWLTENHRHHEVLKGILPHPDRLSKMGHGHVKKHYKDKVKEKALELGFDFSDSDLDDFFTAVMGVDSLPEFDVAHYHHHL